MATGKRIKRQEIIGSVSIFIESYIFSLIAFLLAYNNILKIISNWPNILNIFKSLSSLRIDQVPFISQIIVIIILTFVNVFVWLLLIIRTPPLQKPERLPEIFIPIISTYFWITYNAVPYIPEKLNFYLVPMNTLLFFIHRFHYCNNKVRHKRNSCFQFKAFIQCSYTGTECC